MNTLRLFGHRMQDLYARILNYVRSGSSNGVARTLVRLASQCGQPLDDSVLVTPARFAPRPRRNGGYDTVQCQSHLGPLVGTGLVEVHRRQVVISRPHGLMAIVWRTCPPNLTSPDAR